MTNRMKKMFLLKILQLHFCFLSDFFAIVLGFLFFNLLIFLHSTWIEKICHIAIIWVFFLFCCLVCSDCEKKCFYKKQFAKLHFGFLSSDFFAQKYIYIYIILKLSDCEKCFLKKIFCKITFLFFIFSFFFRAGRKIFEILFF